MRITFVMGLPASGKSTYIKNNFKDTKVIDLYDFQKNSFTFEDIWKSYMDCKDALIEAIKNGEDVVMEHTLLKGIRRKIYIDAIREITNDPIDIIVINPPLEKLRDREKERKIYFNDECILNNLKVLEIPTIEEGFNSVTIIEQ